MLFRSRKTNRVTAIDPESNNEVTLFNPRRDQWNEHFMWSIDRLQIVGMSAIGRATVAGLMLNRERVLAIRQADLEIGRHPPKDDRVENVE